MAIANFEEFCRTYCDVAGIKMPDLAPNAHGMWTATLHTRGVEITLLHFRDRRPDTVFLIADFGAMPGHVGVPGWLTLLEANLLNAEADAPVYSREPRTGHVLLQKPMRLASAFPADIHMAIQNLVNAALQWRKDCFAANPDSASSMLLPDTPAPIRATEELALAREQFKSLHDGIRGLLGQPVDSTRKAQPDELMAFTVDVSGVTFVVAHAAWEQPGFAWVAVFLGEESRDPSAEMVATAMESNFTLMSMARVAKFSRARDTGELIVQFAIPLKQAQPEQFLAELERLAALALELESLAKPMATEISVS